MHHRVTQEIIPACGHQTVQILSVRHFESVGGLQMLCFSLMCNNLDKQYTIIHIFSPVCLCIIFIIIIIIIIFIVIIIFLHISEIWMGAAVMQTISPRGSIKYFWFWFWFEHFNFFLIHLWECHLLYELVNISPCLSPPINSLKWFAERDMLYQHYIPPAKWLWCNLFCLM